MDFRESGNMNNGTNEIITTDEEQLLNNDPPGMTSAEFRQFGKAAVDFIADYLDNIRDRNVLPSVEPGYLSSLLKCNAPDYPERWQDVFADVERIIMPGVTHWHSPQFHAFYPTGQSFPSIVGDMLCSGLGIIGFSWICSPACTELEVAVTDWLGRLFGLPDNFLHSGGKGGGGIIQGSASEASLLAVLAAREIGSKKLLEERPELGDLETARSKMVYYTSEQANSSVWRAGLLAGIKMRKLKPDSSGCLRGEALAKAIAEDRAIGLRPCCVIATLGTTGTCAFDNIPELGQACGDLLVEDGGIWLHVDAAYAGAALLCPEFRWMLNGIERCDSFDVNAHKWMQVNFDCSTMWFQRPALLTASFSVDPEYLKRNDDGMPDYRHWQLPLGRRFRSLKLWFVLRCHGVIALQQSIRRHVKLARFFEQLVRSDERFEIVVPATMGLVVARLKGDDGPKRTEKMLKRIEKRKKIFLTKLSIENVPVIRFVVCSRLSKAEDIRYAWNEICSQLEEQIPDRIQEVDITAPLTTKVPGNNGFHGESDKTEYRTR